MTERGSAVLITNARIITMAGKIYEKGCLLTEKTKIKKIADSINAAENTDQIVIDAKGCWVMPGLIDAHCHIGIQEEGLGTEGNDTNEVNKAVAPFLKGVDAVNPMDSAFHNAIKAGITSVMAGPGSSNVVGGQFVFLKTQGRCIDNMVVLEPAAMKIAFGENPKRNYGDNNMMPSTRMSTGALLREELSKAQDYLKDKEAGGDGFKSDYRLDCWIPVLKCSSVCRSPHTNRRP